MHDIPLFFYPSSIVCIDDDVTLLESIKSVFPNLRVTAYEKPQYAIQALSSYHSPLKKMSFIKANISLENYDMPGHLPVDLNSAMFKEIRDAKARQDEISVIIVDYQMPGINGIDVCRALYHLPVKKILLTGKSNYQQAVEAFNEGIIDCYLEKDHPSLAVELQKHYKLLSEEYFTEITSNLLSYLEVDQAMPFSDPEFISFFKKIRENNGIVEYFLIDRDCNFLLRDKEGKQYYLVVHTSRTLNSFVELHKSDSAVEQYVLAVKNREKVPFFGEDIESWNVGYDKWEENFYSPQILEGREKYYWFISNR